MANQPTKYRKFLAGAATASLVATAVVPTALAAATFTDVPATDTHYENISKAVSLGLFKGKGDGTFAPYENITRGQVAKVLANYVVNQEGLTYATYIEKHNLTKTVTPFNDVPATHADSELYNASLIVKSSGIFTGSNNNLMPANLINRQQMAKVLVNAFDLVDLPGDLSKVTDNKSALAEFVPHINILSENGVTVTEAFRPTENVVRGQMASFLNRAYEIANANPEVVSVSAINATTLTLTGTGLKNLKAEDITVAGNKVTTVQSTDGKTATVTLEGTIPANTDVKVTVKDSVGTKDYTVTFGFVPKSVALQTATFDDDTKGQKLTVLVDGVATSIDYLVSAGYSVQIRAWDKNDADATTTLFGATPSTDGKFKDTAALNTGDYKAQVTIAKDSTVLTSDKVAFTVANINNAATAITEQELTIGGAFVSKSNTLVVDETAQFTKVIVGAGSSKSEYTTTGYTVKSSNPTVVSVNSVTNAVTANGIGTATLTITVGQVTKQVTVTVKGVDREIAKVTPKSSSVTLIAGKANTVKYDVTDQYGDPFLANAAAVDEIYPSSVAGLIGEFTSIADGTGSITLNPTDAGKTGTVTLKDVDGKVLGSFVVSTTAVDNTTTKALAYDSSSLSKDDSLNGELPSDASATYKVNLFTSEGVANGSVTDLTGYQVLYNKDIISLDVAAFPIGVTAVNAGLSQTDDGDVTLTTGTAFKFNAKKAGSTTVTVKDNLGNVVATKTITVTQGTAKITGVTWKTVPTVDYNTTTFNYKSVLDVTEGVTGTDAIVKGITLDNSTLHAIRITATASIYIDNNDNGFYNVGVDSTIGTLSTTVNSFSAGGTLTAGVTGVNDVTIAGPVEGVLTYKVIDTVTSSNPVVSTKGISVNVK